MQHLHVDAIEADECLVYSSGQAVPVDWEFLSVVPHVGSSATMVSLLYRLQLWWRIFCTHSNHNLRIAKGNIIQKFTISDHENIE